MKKLLSVLLLTLFTMNWVWAYINSDSIDYNNPKVYNSSQDFLKAEWDICQSASDGCNRVGIVNWELWAMTEMYCEDVYGQGGQEKWTCQQYNEQKVEYNKYIENNIWKLSDVDPVLWGSWYVVEIDWLSDEKVKVVYEDWHIQEEMTLNTDDLNINGDEDGRICTMEYAPVCAEVQVQCIKAPCYPVPETFSNKCMAWDNPILYSWECESNFDYTYYKKLQLRQQNVLEVIWKLPTTTLEKAYELSNTLIEKTKLLKIATWLMNQRITRFVFLREMISNELTGRE